MGHWLIPILLLLVTFFFNQELREMVNFDFRIYLTASLGLLTFITIFFFMLEKIEVSEILKDSRKKILIDYKKYKKIYDSCNFFQKVILFFRNYSPKKIISEYDAINLYTKFNKIIINLLITVGFFVFMQPKGKFMAIGMFFFWFSFFLILEFFYIWRGIVLKRILKKKELI